jgi:hypothetical protein
MADNKFDNNKNWSTMINRQDNDIRNEVMRRVKSKQIKDRCLHDFIRTYRKDVIVERQQKTANALEDVTIASSNGNKMASSNTNVKEEFTDYLKSKVTK